MRILTVRQPWAWAIIHGGKDVENRVRNIAGDYRGPVAIHSALRWDQDAIDDIEAGVWPLNVGPDWNSPGGVILGVANLWAVHEDRDGGNCCPKRPVGGPGGSPWAQRNVWHLCLNNPRPLVKPIPYKGALGLRTLPEYVAAQVLAAVAS